MQIKINNLNITYEDKKVIANLCDTIASGEKIALIGTSGIGKTSLINAIMNLISYEGDIQFDEPPIFATVFQEDRLLNDFTVFTNIKIVTPQLSNDKITEYIRSIDLNPKDLVRELSGGMKRRVAILRGILAPSNLLIMDEPFKGLDTNTKDRVMTLVKEKASDKTMILITHDISEAQYYNCRIIELCSYVP